MYSLFWKQSFSNLIYNFDTETLSKKKKHYSVLFDPVQFCSVAQSCTTPWVMYDSLAANEIITSWSIYVIKGLGSAHAAKF